MAVRFDAEGDAYSATTGVPGSTSTVLCWVYLSVDRNAFSTVFDSSASTSNYLQVSTGSDGVTLGVHTHTGSVNGITMTVGAWHRLAVTCDGTTFTLYTGTASGALTVDTVAKPSNWAPTTLRIGASVWPSEWFNGRVAGFKTWNVALNAAEVEAELGRYTPRRTAGLVRWHPLLVPETVDYSGNGNTLTGGSPTAEEGPPLRWGRRRGRVVGGGGTSIGLTDTGVGADTIDVMRDFPLGDAGVGSDTIQVFDVTAGLVLVNLFDSGVGTETDLGTGLLLDDHGTGTDDITVLRIPFARILAPFRPGPGYDLGVVARIPQPVGPPVLVEVDAIDWSDLTWTNELSKPQTLTATCLYAGLTPPVRQRLEDPAALPLELWLHRNGQRVFAGPLRTARIDGENLNLGAAGLLDYLVGMVVHTDQVFAQVDQFTIAATLIDQWQLLEFGHHGILTDEVGLSGILRDATYLRDELHHVDQRVAELGRRINGFDIEVDPSSRRLQLWWPLKGVDRSSGEDAVVFDGRNITSSNVMISLAPGDVASEGYGTGTSAGAGALFSTKPNLELRARYGRTAVTGTWDSVSEQSTLDDHVQALVDARGSALIVPGPAARNTPDADLSSYAVGDTISYRPHQLFSAGAFRIRKQAVQVSGAGQESITLEFV